MRPKPRRSASSLTVASIAQPPNFKPTPSVTMPSQFPARFPAETLLNEPDPVNPNPGTKNPAVLLVSLLPVDVSFFIPQLPIDLKYPARPASQSVNCHSPPRFTTG